MYPGVKDLDKYAITSDDLFSLDHDPGKTLVIGGGYIAVECAGFLNGIGKDVTMINRSTFLRVMDEDMSFRITDDMEQNGVNVMTHTVPVSVKKLGENLYEVELKTGKDKISKIQVNTILVAIGRDAQPDKLDIGNAGVIIDEWTLKIKGREHEKERSNVDHIYAIGDVLYEVPELMPIAQKSGKLLAHRIHDRLIGKATEHLIREGTNSWLEDEALRKYKIDYNYIPTTVFSPTEYSFVGLNEQEAIKAHGDEDIEVYHREVTPLQFSIVKGNTKAAYLKVICLKSDNERVIGMHFFGPNADEVIGGYAMSMKLGLKKEHLDSSVGIHPSTSEDFFNLDVTKRSGEDYSKTDC